MIWILYITGLSLLIAFAVCYFMKQQFIMKICIFVAQALMVGLLAVSTLELIFLIGLGDFCMNPTDNVFRALEEGSELWRTAKYYSLCDPDTLGGEGDNFIHRGLAMAYEKRRQLGRALQILYMPDEFLDHDQIPREGGPTCGVNSIDKNVQEAFYALQRLAPQFQVRPSLASIAYIVKILLLLIVFIRFAQAIARSVSCGTLHKLWRLTFEVAACNEVLLGVFSLWWSQIILTFGLFLICVSASIMMLYFDKFWDIGQNPFKVPAETEKFFQNIVVNIGIESKEQKYEPVPDTDKEV